MAELKPVPHEWKPSNEVADQCDQVAVFKQFLHNGVFVDFIWKKGTQVLFWGQLNPSSDMGQKIDDVTPAKEFLQDETQWTSEIYSDGNIDICMIYKRISQ